MLLLLFVVLLQLANFSFLFFNSITNHNILDFQGDHSQQQQHTTS